MKAKEQQSKMTAMAVDTKSAAPVVDIPLAPSGQSTHILQPRSKKAKTESSASINATAPKFGMMPPAIDSSATAKKVNVLDGATAADSSKLRKFDDVDVRGSPMLEKQVVGLTLSTAAAASAAGAIVSAGSSVPANENSNNSNNSVVASTDGTAVKKEKKRVTPVLVTLK